MEWLRITTDALPTIPGAKIWPGPSLQSLSEFHMVLAGAAQLVLENLRWSPSCVWVPAVGWAALVFLVWLSVHMASHLTSASLSLWPVSPAGESRLLCMVAALLEWK